MQKTPVAALLALLILAGCTAKAPPASTTTPADSHALFPTSTDVVKFMDCYGCRS